MELKHLFTSNKEQSNFTKHIKYLQRYILIFIMTLILTFQNQTYAYAVSTLCESVLMFELETGTVLYEKLPDQKMYPASLTKIMTAILAIEMGNLDDILTVDEDTPFELEPGSSHIALDPGEQLSLKDLLYATMLPSANDAALVIAKHYGGTEEAFLELMNNKALELGMTNTNFENPHGLHDDNHYTTASDLAKLVTYCMENETFCDIVKVPRYEIPATNLKEARLINTTNDLLASGELIPMDGAWIQKIYEGSKGIKTGYTPQAGHTLASYTEKNGLGLVVIVLKGGTNETYVDIHNLLNYGFENYKLELLEKSNEFVEDFFINEENSVPLVTKEDVYTVSLINSEAETTKQVTLYEDINYPIRKDDAIGTLDFVSNGEIVATTELISASSSDVMPVVVELQTTDVEEKEPFDLPIWLDIILILIAIILLLRFYNKTRIRIIRKRRKKRREKLRKQGL